MSILMVMLVVLAIIFLAISVDRRLSEQADLIVKLQKEGFLNSNHAYNQMASFVGMPNYLLSTAVNDKFNKNVIPRYIPDRNAPRGTHAFNFLTKNKILLPDANDITGYRNVVGFPGPINPTKLPKGNSREVKKPEEVTVTEEPNAIQIDGAVIKPEKVISVEGEPVTTPTTTIENIEGENEETNFSVNGRMNASAARNLAPNESSAEEIVTEIVNTPESFRVGKSKTKRRSGILTGRR